MLREELDSIRMGCQSMGAGDEKYDPKITYMTALKRHHTRFFPTRNQDASGKSLNVMPGTVVDQAITHPFEFDFFMVSHFGIQVGEVVSLYGINCPVSSFVPVCI